VESVRQIKWVMSEPTRGGAREPGAPRSRRLPPSAGGAACDESRAKRSAGWAVARGFSGGESEDVDRQVFAVPIVVRCRDDGKVPGAPPAVLAESGGRQFFTSAGMARGGCESRVGSGRGRGDRKL
jgi:hypothetical protein